MERVQEDLSDLSGPKQELNPDICQVQHLVLYNQGLVLLGISEKSGSTDSN